MIQRKVGRSLCGIGCATLTLGLLVSGSVLATNAGASKAPPSTFKFSWGTFHVASRIEKNIRAHKALNFDMSYQAVSEAGAPAELRAGLSRGAAWVKKTYGVTINVKLIGSTNTTAPAQISQITSLVSAGELTCVGVEPITPGAFEKVINSTMSAGVPVMTVNTDSPPSHRIAYYGVDDTTPKSPLWTGRVAGEYTVSWAKKHHIVLRSAALVTGTTSAPWAQGRMKGWEEVVKSAFPHIKIVGTPTDALTTGYTPSPITSDMSAFMTGHPTVQFYFDSDWGAAEIGGLIASRGLKGKVFTLGYNVNSTYIKDLRAGDIIGTVDQRYDLQAENFVKGCASMLLAGKVPSPHQYIDPSIWTPTNVKAAVALYKSIPGSLT
jgi:ABC-type sugar transport system substrate-binding protein